MSKITRTGIVVVLGFVVGFLLFSSCEVIAEEKRAPAPAEAIGVEQGIFVSGMAHISMDWNEGEAFCAEKGYQLPLASELKSVAANTGEARYREYKWPNGIFWTREPEQSGHKVVFMGSGADMWFPDNSRQWVVCVGQAASGDKAAE